MLAACGDNRDVLEPDAPVTPEPDAPAGPETRAVTLRFTPMVGDAAFACGQTYANLGVESTTITPRDFRFYVHDVQLIAADGARVPVELTADSWQYQGVALLDFEDFTGGCQDGTAETNTTLRGTVPDGTYIGVAFTIGIPDALNHADMTSLPAPLNLTGLWWSWRFGHIFLAAVTHTEITEPTPGTNDHYFHLGAIDCTGDPEIGEAVTCAKPNLPQFAITGLDPLTQPIVVDYGALLSRSKLATTVGCHSFSEEPCAGPFDLVGLDWATGARTDTQVMFRVAP